MKFGRAPTTISRSLTALTLGRRIRRSAPRTSCKHAHEGPGSKNGSSVHQVPDEGEPAQLRRQQVQRRVVGDAEDLQPVRVAAGVRPAGLDRAGGREAGRAGELDLALAEVAVRVAEVPAGPPRQLLDLAPRSRDLALRLLVRARGKHRVEPRVRLEVDRLEHRLELARVERLAVAVRALGLL